MLEVREESHGNSLTVCPTIPVKHIGAVKGLVGGYGEGVCEGHLLAVDNNVVVYAGGYTILGGESERGVERLTQQVRHTRQAVHVELKVTIVAGLDVYREGGGHGSLPFVDLLRCSFPEFSLATFHILPHVLDIFYFLGLPVVAILGVY